MLNPVTRVALLAGLIGLAALSFAGLSPAGLASSADRGLDSAQSGPARSKGDPQLRGATGHDRLSACSQTRPAPLRPGSTSVERALPSQLSVLPPPDGARIESPRSSRIVPVLVTPLRGARSPPLAA